MDQFIFDDAMEDVGAEVEANCPKCRVDTTHIILSKYEDEIRRVQCNVCGDAHSFRKARGESEEEEEKLPAPSKRKVKVKPTWEQFIAKNKKPARAYALGEYFKELEFVEHPKFGPGFVSENIGTDKIEITFADEPRVLVHNRKGLTLPFLVPPKGAKGKKAAATAGKPDGQPAPAKAALKAAPPVAAKAAAKPAAKAAAKPAAKAPAKKAAAKPAPKKPAKPAPKKKPAAKKPTKPAKKPAPAKKKPAAKKK
jgi:hypothetical protein